MDLGKKIRLIRKQQNRTLEEVASLCGVTRGMLSKIENGVAAPTIARLMQIAEALGVKVADLLEDNKENGTIHTEVAIYRNENRWIKTDNGYSFYAFAAGRPDKLMQPYYFIAKKGEIKKHLLSHKGEEFVFVLQGEMNYKVGSVEYALRAGDTVYFNSLEEHTLTPMTDEVRYLAVICSS